MEALLFDPIPVCGLQNTRPSSKCVVVPFR